MFGILISNAFLSLLLGVLFVCCTVKYRRIASENEKINLYLKRIANVVNSVRYGNLQARADEGYNDITDAISNNLNTMIESIADREAMIKEYIEKEKETNVLKSDFIATLTHDLKVPVIAQDNTFELFLSGKFGALTEIQEDVLKRLKMSNVDLKYLINTLLEIYKTEQAEIKINITKDVDIFELLEEIINEMKSIADLHKKKINLENHLENLKTVDIDVFLVKRVLQNLVLNAILHSVNSDTVDILLDKENKKEFSISVKDYGCGIAREDIQKIFEKYYTGNSKFAKSGVGLGLYLSNKIIMKHKGKIEVESKEGKGTTFKIVLGIH